MFLKLFECGYVPIPIFAMGKNPAIKNDWTRWCRERPPIALVEQWNDAYIKNGLNIGVTCGPASGIVAVDIDTDDPEILNACPPSPVRRRGMKGEARFFRYDSRIVSMSVPKLDIMADGRQLLIPPSIHPTTKKPYIWLTPDTLLDFKPADLPALDMAFIERLRPQLARTNDGAGEGRNNRLVDIVSAMRGRGEPESKIVKEVYDWDMMYHSPRLFTDAKEGYRAAGEQQAFNNAWTFVNSVTRSLIKRGLAFVGDSDALVIHIDEDAEKAAEDAHKSRTYPEPKGLVKDIRDLIVEFSEREMPNIALGGAVALMSAICSNKFRFDRCWPNTYVMNLAPTGSGKSFPQRIVSMILDERISSGLIGFGSYQSSSAFTKNLVSKRERLDMIDEVASLFAQMKGGGLYQMGIVDEMCKVWSASSGKFNASEYAEREDTGTCHNPCVNILGSSTPGGIKGNITGLMTTKGLIPRFLIFSHEDYGRRKPDRLNTALLDRVVWAVEAILNTPKRRSTIEVDVLRGPVHDPVDLTPVDPAAIDLFASIREEFSDRIESEPSQPLKDMLTRGKEQTMKLATLHAAGHSGRSITVEDLTWARGTFETCLHNATPLIEETATDSEWERDVQQMLNEIRKKGGVVTEAYLSNRIRRLPPQRLDMVLRQLQRAGLIVRAESSRSRGPKVSGWSIKPT